MEAGFQSELSDSEPLPKTGKQEVRVNRKAEMVDQIKKQNHERKTGQSISQLGKMEICWWSGVAVVCLDWSVGRVEPLPLKGELPCIWRNPGNVVVSSKCTCSIFEFSWWWLSHFMYISCVREESFISSKLFLRAELHSRTPPDMHFLL